MAGAGRILAVYSWATHPHPYSVSKFLRFMGLRDGMRGKIVLPLDLAAESSWERVYGAFFAKNRLFEPNYYGIRPARFPKGIFARTALCNCAAVPQAGGGRGGMFLGYVAVTYLTD